MMAENGLGSLWVMSLWIRFCKRSKRERAKRPGRGECCGSCEDIGRVHV